jgi:hypothetical protein
VTPLAGLVAISASIALGSLHRDHRALARRNIRLFQDQSADIPECGARHFQLQVLRSSYSRAKVHVESLENGPDKWALATDVEILRTKLLRKEGSFRADCVKGLGEMIPGGRASGRRPSEFDPRQVRAGVKIEMEHTSDPRIAREIAMDHLTEDPRYYVKLQRAGL